MAIMISRFFQLIGYNEELIQKRNLGDRHDGLFSIDKNIPIRMICIFVDGSTFIRFDVKIKISNNQCVYLYHV